MYKFFLYSFLTLSLITQDAHALDPFEAASLAEKIEKQDRSSLNGFSLVSEKIERPYGDATDQITAQLWRNDATNEAVIVFHTAKEEGIMALRGLARRFFGFEDTLTYTREQGRIYNDLVTGQYPQLAGGLAQKAVAAVTDVAVAGVMGAGRGISTLAKKAGQAAWNWWSPPAVGIQQQGAAAAEALKDDHEVSAHMIGKEFISAVNKLYKGFEADLKGFNGTKFLVGHSLAGYIAQYLAHQKDLDGYSFGAMGLGLKAEVETNKVFTNIIRKSDHFGDLHKFHFGSVKIIPDLPLTVVDGLAEKVAALKVADSISTRYEVMSKYLTKNHGIDGYARQLAELSPQGSPKRSASPVTAPTPVATSTATSSTTIASGAASTIAPPPPPPAPKQKLSLPTASPKAVAPMASDDDDNAAASSSSSSSSSAAKLSAPSGDARADMLAMIAGGGFKFKNKVTPKVVEVNPRGIVDEGAMDPLERDYRKKIMEQNYHVPGAKWPTSMTKQLWYDAWKKNPYYGFDDIGDDQRTEADRAKREGIIKDLRKTYGLSDNS